jgi:argininosuccinate lyase
MSLTKRFQELFNGTSINQNRVDASVKICRETAIEYADWIIEKKSQFPEAVIRHEVLFDVFEKEKSGQLKTMIPPKQKAIELYGKVRQLTELTHAEILEILDFVAETKTLSPKATEKEKEYWETLREEAKKLKP